jgi:hypothetical protein
MTSYVNSNGFINPVVEKVKCGLLARETEILFKTNKNEGNMMCSLGRVCGRYQDGFRTNRPVFLTSFYA